MIEYSFLLIAVFMPISAATVAAGRNMLHEYRVGRAHVLRATP
jgi:hypothetical protein